MSARWPSLPTGRTLVMGILNVTPDSFSDGGEHLDPEAAVAHGLALVRDGADLVDVGGESTRPGAEPVDPAQERRRILPVVRRLTERGVVVSVDTLHPDTAEAALQAGAGIVNDVSGARLGEEMIELIARTGAPYILTHARGDSATMDSLARYADPVAEVRAELLGLRQRLLDGGVDPAQIVLDPGLGFAKGGDQDWRLLAGLDALTGLGHPVLVAASRKRFLGSTLAAARWPRTRPFSTFTPSARRRWDCSRQPLEPSGKAMRPSERSTRCQGSLGSSFWPSSRATRRARPGRPARRATSP